MHGAVAISRNDPKYISTVIITRDVARPFHQTKAGHIEEMTAIGIHKKTSVIKSLNPKSITQIITATQGIEIVNNAIFRHFLKTRYPDPKRGSLEFSLLGICLFTQLVEYP